jgi:hypothetical protein
MGWINQGLVPDIDKTISFSPKISRAALMPTQPQTQSILGILSPQVETRARS